MSRDNAMKDIPQWVAINSPDELELGDIVQYHPKKT